MMGNMMFYGMGGLLMAIFWAVVFVGGGYFASALFGLIENTNNDDNLITSLLYNSYYN
jgi:hypothetical protein